MVRDAFVAGISSLATKRSLLEHQKISYTEAYRLVAIFYDTRRNNLSVGRPHDAKVESAMATDAVDFFTSVLLSLVEADRSAFVTNKLLLVDVCSVEIIFDHE